MSNAEHGGEQQLEMRKTTFAVPKMDCPSEERLIRMALAPVEAVVRIDVDLSLRKVNVTYVGELTQINDRIVDLGLGATSENTVAVDAQDVETQEETAPEESRVLKILLAINATMFLAELIIGVVAQSTGLIADSLDMLADAAIYGLTLLAVGQTLARQQRAARLSGWVQMALALAVFGEVGRRAVFGSEPLESAMIVMGIAALVANLVCLALLSRHRKGGVHLQASWIFSTSDVLANMGVIAAGVLVAVTDSAIPDLVIGTIVGAVVLAGAVRILRLKA